jgi:CRP/FNR family cyclic AMP-dependent transcriptional regulator
MSTEPDQRPLASLMDRFAGPSGRPTLVETLLGQRVIGGSEALAEAVAERAQLLELAGGDELIRQGGGDHDVYFILAGDFAIEVNGRRINTRTVNDTVGEMAAVMPSLPRSATVVALGPAIVGKITAAALVELGEKHPRLWRQLAKALAQRLYQRNSLIAARRDAINVFIISSSEALPVVRAVQNAFEHDPFFVKPWTENVFKVSTYPIPSLEGALDQSDFSIVIAQPDDMITSRGGTMVTPRDNVIFELGLSIGRIGLDRTFLLEPRGEDVKLPSDLTGLTVLAYRPGPPKDLDTLVAPACNKLRDIFNDMGPKS